MSVDRYAILINALKTEFNANDCYEWAMHHCVCGKYGDEYCTCPKCEPHKLVICPLCKEHIELECAPCIERDELENPKPEHLKEDYLLNAVKEEANTAKGITNRTGRYWQQTHCDCDSDYCKCPVCEKHDLTGCPLCSCYTNVPVEILSKYDRWVMYKNDDEHGPKRVMEAYYYKTLKEACDAGKEFDSTIVQNWNWDHCTCQLGSMSSCTSSCCRRPCACKVCKEHNLITCPFCADSGYIPIAQHVAVKVADVVDRWDEVARLMGYMPVVDDVYVDPSDDFQITPEMMVAFRAALKRDTENKKARKSDEDE